MFLKNLGLMKFSLIINFNKICPQQKQTSNINKKLQIFFFVISTRNQIIFLSTRNFLCDLAISYELRPFPGERAKYRSRRWRQWGIPELMAACFKQRPRIAKS